MKMGRRCLNLLPIFLFFDFSVCWRERLARARKDLDCVHERDARASGGIVSDLLKVSIILLNTETKSFSSFTKDENIIVMTLLEIV
ncbi:hypothetical protein [Flavobacterium panacagri]|uniref:hypothetical protein n=1 Tax=Flavobacterium panacagri TaxID=3034146 RepID=UPI0025A52CEF|nr:hypothetical protein [Flavobacterium panacagri]